MTGDLAIVTPFYSREGDQRLDYFRGYTLPSTLQQMCAKGFYWFVVDDGSDNREAIAFLKELDREVANAAVLWRERQPEDLATASNALNHGINHVLEHTDCTKAAYLHSDDRFLPESLELRASILDQGYDMVYGRLATLREDGSVEMKPLPDIDHNSPEIMSGYFPHWTSMWTTDMVRRLIEKRGELFGTEAMFDKDTYFGEDLGVTLLSRGLIANEGYKLGFVDTPLYLLVESQDSITSSTRELKLRRQVRGVYQRHGITPPSSLAVWKDPLIALKLSIPGPVRRVLSQLKRLATPTTHEEPAQAEHIDPEWFIHDQ